MLPPELPKGSDWVKFTPGTRLTTLRIVLPGVCLAISSWVIRALALVVSGTAMPSTVTTDARAGNDDFFFFFGRDRTGRLSEGGGRHAEGSRRGKQKQFFHEDPQWKKMNPGFGIYWRRL